MIMHFYGTSYSETIDLTLPQMQGLLDEIPNIYKTFNPSGTGGYSGGRSETFASAKRMM